VTFYQFPRQHRKHLRTSNPVESPFAAGRLRTAAAKRFKKVENATAVIWKTLLIAQKTFRRLDAPELLEDVAGGALYCWLQRIRRQSFGTSSRRSSSAPARSRWVTVITRERPSMRTCPK
jgi:hypothetical protein